MEHVNRAETIDETRYMSGTNRASIKKALFGLQVMAIRKLLIFQDKRKKKRLNEYPILILFVKPLCAF